MKKVLAFVLVAICVFSLFACKTNEKAMNEEAVYVVNAEIIGIDYENLKIHVKDCDGGKYFEKKSAIDCSSLSADKKLIYVDYDTGNLSFIEVEDLLIGDLIIVTVNENQLQINENMLIKPDHIQLSTQRNK